MIWRSGVAVLFSTGVVAFVVASVTDRGDRGLHAWGQPQSVETARLELQGAWAEDAPTGGETVRFSVLIFDRERLSWYTLTSLEEKIESVANWEYTIQYDPLPVPHRLTFTPIDDLEAPPILCVYAREGDVLKLWRGTHLFPQPTGRTEPHYVLKKTALPK